MHLRRMNENDLPQVLDLQRELAFQDWNEKQFLSEIKAAYAYCVVCEDDGKNGDFNDGRDGKPNGERGSELNGKLNDGNNHNNENLENQELSNACNSSRIKSTLLGYAIFHLLGPDSELLSIATRPSEQRKGVGTQLLNAGLDQLTHDDQCFLEVRNGNAKARSFYEKNGFELYGNRKKYYADGEDAALYKFTKR